VATQWRGHGGPQIRALNETNYQIHMTRLQIELDESKLKSLEELMRACGLRTKKDLINNALALLEWAVRERQRGNAIVSLDEGNDKYKEVYLPIFAHVEVTAIPRAKEYADKSV
jgi:Arc/MetJ family transcription regulator